MKKISLIVSFIGLFIAYTPISLAEREGIINQTLISTSTYCLLVSVGLALLSIGSVIYITILYHEGRRKVYVVHKEKD